MPKDTLQTQRSERKKAAHQNIRKKKWGQGAFRDEETRREEEKKNQDELRIRTLQNTDRNSEGGKQPNQQIEQENRKNSADCENSQIKSPRKTRGGKETTQSLRMRKGKIHTSREERQEQKGREKKRAANHNNNKRGESKEERDNKRKKTDAAEDEAEERSTRKKRKSNGKDEERSGNENTGGKEGEKQRRSRRKQRGNKE